MTRQEDLEQSIRESYDIICRYEDIVRTSDRPEEVQRAKRVIQEQKGLIAGCLAELRPLIDGVVPEDIAQMIAYAAALDVAALTGPGALPSPQAIAQHRAALRERLAQDAQARWGGMSAYIQEEGAALPIEASPYQTGRLGPRENLLAALHAADHLLVLGEPGSGKTVALERLAWELCADPETVGDAGTVGDPEPVVPVLVRLFQYDGKSLREWMRALLQGTGHLRLDGGRALDAFLQDGPCRCIFLLDGLNEVAPAYRDALVGEVVRWRASFSHHALILTSRPQDELWRRLRGEVERALVLQPVADERARAYLVAHLGERGEALYARLDERLREMARTPLILWLVKEAGAAGESLPGNRGELYARFVSRMLRRDTERRMDAGIPERVKRQALVDLAFHLSREQRISCPREEALEVVARALPQETSEEVLGACARHGLLAGEEALWYAPHQTVQEHFAALALREMAERERNASLGPRLLRGARRALTRTDEGLAGLAADEWWTETYVQLAGLVEDADWLAREVTRANPWLAWWCMEEGRAVSEGTREAVAERSTRLLESERVGDRRRAVAALARMRSERALGPLFRAAADEDEEVAGLAAQTLAETGETVRTLVAEALQGTDRRPWRAALRCLGALPNDSLWAEIPYWVWQEVLGQSMVWVPAGPFLMGSDKGKDPQAYDDELPQHLLDLPGYWIGRCPVTVTQFRAFVEGSGHRPANRDSLRGEGDHPVVNVTWHDALAYCRWLARETGLPVTLPSEAEWEKAARGADGRVYPWGDDLPDESRCNFGDYSRGTTPVGRYSPRGDSPCGCADMAGNVLEWTRSLSEGYPYDASDGREDLGAGDLRVLRGGAFDSSAGGVRCACRDRVEPDLWYRFIGLRVVVGPRLCL